MYAAENLIQYVDKTYQQFLFFIHKAALFDFKFCLQLECGILGSLLHVKVQEAEITFPPTYINMQEVKIMLSGND